jgi:hypothetical protein
MNGDGIAESGVIDLPSISLVGGVFEREGFADISEINNLENGTTKSIAGKVRIYGNDGVATAEVSFKATVTKFDSGVDAMIRETKRKIFTIPPTVWIPSR